MRYVTQSKRRDINVGSRSVAEDLFMKFVACSEEDKEAFINHWNSFQSNATRPFKLSYGEYR